MGDAAQTPVERLETLAYGLAAFARRGLAAGARAWSDEAFVVIQITREFTGGCGDPHGYHDVIPPRLALAIVDEHTGQASVIEALANGGGVGIGARGEQLSLYPGNPRVWMKFIDHFRDVEAGFHKPMTFDHFTTMHRESVARAETLAKEAGLSL